MLARRDPHHNQAEGQGRVTKGNSVSGPRSRAHPGWNERLVAAAGDAVGKRPYPQLGEGGRAKPGPRTSAWVIDEIFTRNAGQ